MPFKEIKLMEYSGLNVLSESAFLPFTFLYQDVCRFDLTCFCVILVIIILEIKGTDFVGINVVSFFIFFL